VVILGGSNDFSSFSGPVLLASTQNNIRSMIELAHERGIVVFVGTTPPVAKECLSSLEAEQFEFGSASKYNDWLRGHCTGTKFQIIDFDHAYLEAGYQLSSLLPDGSHPNELGYSLMANAANSAFENLISRK
jgi:lysophospholipase L1-like esterase